MSKAFTKEDEDAGFTAPTSAPRLALGPVTPLGARLAREELATLAADAALTRTEKLVAIAAAPVVEISSSEVAILGTRVRYRVAGGAERTAALVSPAEVGLVPHGVSLASPLGSALLGARAGDIRELERGGEADEVTVVSVEVPE